MNLPKRGVVFTASVIVSVGLLFSLFSFVNAERLDEILNEIEQYQAELSRLENQANTLKNQIAQFNAQIYLASLKISETEERISLLGGRIDQLEGSLSALSDAFSTRVSETYKMRRLEDPLIFLITSQDLTEAVIRFHYLKRIQEADREFLVRLQKAQNIYVDEKVDKEDLAEELEGQKQVLGVQKVAKSDLLEQTRNDESRYQTLLNQALAEKAAIERALVSGVEVGPVSTGDPIGLVGNSGYPGCSTGKHLHFEVRNGGNWTDPAPYLNNKTVQDEQNNTSTAIGSGGWPWPIQDNVRLTQHYGSTPYSWKYTYSGGIHTGLDMVSTSSDVIKAPADGTLYRSSQNCGGSSVINILYIEHANGVISFYLHVQ